MSATAPVYEGTRSIGAVRAADKRSSVGRPLFWLLMLLAAYFIPRGELPNPDSHLALSYALVEQHTVRIDSYLEMSGTREQLLDKAVYCGPKTDVRTCHHYYSDKAPGISLLVAAAYTVVRPFLPHNLMPANPGSDRFVLRWLLSVLAITAPCALFLAGYWRFMAGLAGPKMALIVAVGYGFGSMALPFSMLLFSHALTAALLFWAFMLVFAATGIRGQSGADAQQMAMGGRSWKPVAAGVLAGYAIGCEYPTAIIAVLLGIYAFMRVGTLSERTGDGIRYALGVLIGLIPLFIYNLVAFGSPLALGYLHLTDPQYARGMSHGILGVGLPMWDAVWGTTFSPYRGLFILSPWLLLAVPGVVAMAAAGWKREAVLSVAVSVAYFLFQSGYAFWDGGASVGPRHFLPALPFLALPIVFALKSQPLRRLAIGLVAFSVATLILILITNPTYQTAPVPFVDETLHDLAIGRLQNNWGMLFRLSGPASLLPLAVGVVLLSRQIALRAGCYIPIDRRQPECSKL